VKKLFEIIYEDAELLVINKPAGLVCHPTKGDRYSSLISRVRLHLGPASHPHLVNRLDRETSGVTLVAKTDDAARELRQLMESRVVNKEYLAIVHGHVNDDHGVIEAPLGKDEDSRVVVKDCVRSDGSPSKTEFWVDSRFERSVSSLHVPRNLIPDDSPSSSGSPPLKPFTLLRVQPHTGRKHQIRIHLAHLGHPIVGDKIYGGDEDLYLALVEDRLTAEQERSLILPYQALHAKASLFEWRGWAMDFQCQPEQWFCESLSQQDARILSL
jgi:23S rRNA pseudouridine1911/1915/1917 synthase